MSVTWSCVYNVHECDLTCVQSLRTIWLPHQAVGAQLFLQRAQVTPIVGESFSVCNSTHENLYHRILVRG